MRAWCGERTIPVLGPAVVVMLGVAAVGRAPAQATRDLIEEALDQRLERLEIENLPIRDALSRLQQETGLRFELDRVALERMPYGERTRVSIVIRNMSVRQGMTRVCAGLGLRLRVGGDRVYLEPAPVLERLGRRISIEEVNLLERLARQPWSETRRADPVPLEFRFDPQSRPRETLDEVLAGIPAGNALEQLDSATGILGWSWRPQGGRLVFEARAADILRRLDRPLDMTYQRIGLDELLVDLARRAGVTIFFEPGALKQVAARDRVVDLIQRGVSVRQTLERICGNTGLRYTISDEGVEIVAPLDTSAGPRASNIERWVRIELQIRPGVKMDVFLRQDQLPPDIRAECERQLREILSGPPATGGETSR